MGRTNSGHRWERAAGWVSLGAGAVHGGVSPSHFAEWWGYGLFFVVAATAQVLFGLALLTDAINPKDTGPQWRTVKRWFLMAGILGNAAIIGLYVVTRTSGIPWFGPEAGEREAIAGIDLVSKALEAILILLVIMVLRSDSPSRAEDP